MTGPDSERSGWISGAPRTGIGVDVHAFATEGSARVLHLAGLEWPGEPALEGHSDGDVAAHAAADALLSAAGLGDLGSVFGTDEPRWAGAAGTMLLAEAARQSGTRRGRRTSHSLGTTSSATPTTPTTATSRSHS